MKKHLSIAGCILAFFISFRGAAQEKLNLNMEDVDAKTNWPKGWKMGSIGRNESLDSKLRTSYRLDEKVHHAGKYSLQIDWSDTPKEWTATSYVINKSFKGKKIVLKGFVKTEDAASVGLWMRLDGEGGGDNGFDNMMDRPIKGTTDWKEYAIELDYDGEVVSKIVVGGLIIGKGKMWMDDLSISIDGKDISVAPVYAKSAYPADADTAFSKGSGLGYIAAGADKITDLTNLGLIWGFMKYYHDGVKQGNYNMDAELFRVLRKVNAAANTGEANTIMERWVDGFSKQPECNNCLEKPNKEDIQLQPDYSTLFTEGNLPASLVAKLDYIKANRTKGEKQYYNAPAAGVGNPGFAHEKKYDDSPYPDAGTRLLALFRYWNMVQYYFPYRHLIGENWNNVLPESIPDFVNAKDELEYQRACLKLIARIHDTHANLWDGADALVKSAGAKLPPFQAKFIEGKLVVVDYYADTLNIKSLVKPGDIIEKIDGVPVQELLTKHLPLAAASNYATQLRDICSYRGWLLRSDKDKAELAISRGGIATNITVPRVTAQRNFYSFESDGRHTKSFEMLHDNIGYIYPGKLQDNDLDTIKETFENTKGIIIDLRCYPSSWMTFTYPEWFTPKPTPFVKFSIGSNTMPGLFTVHDGPRVGKQSKHNYKGKIVIIVNASTQSQAEYVTMALSTAPNATVIGSTTAGADGNVSEISLPGGLSTMFSGIGIQYPDGTETQRKGVKINKVVEPTIQGIKEGRDELMEAALKIIKS